MGRKKIGQCVRERGKSVAGYRRTETRDWGRAIVRYRMVWYCMLETCERCWESVAGRLYRGWR